MRSNISPGMMSSGMTVSMAVILMPELLGTGLGAGEMVVMSGAFFFTRGTVWGLAVVEHQTSSNDFFASPKVFGRTSILSIKDMNRRQSWRPGLSL